jgi:hypothetical protein
MDYSTLPTDPDHPAGSSPWASSPQHNRTSFAQTHNTEVPPSPLPPARSPYSTSHTRDQGSIDSTDRSEQQETHPGAAAINGNPESLEQNLGQQEVPHDQDHQNVEPQRSPYQSHDQDSPEGARPDPQRYHHQKQGVRQTAPHGKLQAKITALERTGRKDPILRFDVHVSAIHCNLT